MRRTHSAAPHAHMLLARSSLSVPAAAVLHEPSVEALFAANLQPGADRAILGEIPAKRCLLVAFRRTSRVRLSVS